MANIFHVLTEFKFEVGSAVLQSDRLTGAVDSISNAADNALLSFQKLGLGVVGYMGMGTGSILGLFQAAIQSSEKFEASQRALANIFLTNGLFTGTNAFVEGLEQADHVLNSIAKKGAEFGLATGPMIQLTKTLGAQLIGQKLDDASLSKSIDLARGYAKSATVLGFDPELAMGQLQRTLQGGASMGDPLFRSLVQDTSAFAKIRSQKDPTKTFNAKSEAERLDILTKALGQFGSNAQVVAANANSLTNQMQILKDNLFGIVSIFRPIGKLLTTFLAPELRKLNVFVQKEGRDLVRHISVIFSGVLTNTEDLIVNLMQLKGLKTDFNAAGIVSSITGLLFGLNPLLKMFGVAPIGALIKLESVFGMLFGASTTLMSALSGVVSQFLVVLGIFQLFRRAIAIAFVEDSKAYIAAGIKLAKAIATLKVVFSPLINAFGRAFDAVARFISPLFRLSLIIEALVWLIDWAAAIFTAAFATIQGIFFATFQLFTNIFDLIKSGAQGILNVLMGLQNPLGAVLTGNSVFKGVFDAFQAGIDDSIETTMNAVNGPTGEGVVNQTTNLNGDIHISNNFKEQMEPDRIAFSLKEQIFKAASNNTGASGRSLGAALTR